MHFNCFSATTFLALVLASIVCMVCAVPVGTDLDIWHQPEPASTIVERGGNVLQKPNSVLSLTFFTAAEIEARMGIKHTNILPCTEAQDKMMVAMVEKMMKLLAEKLDLYKPVHSFTPEMCAWWYKAKDRRNVQASHANGMVRIQMAESKLDTKVPVRGHISMGNKPEKAGGENGQKEEVELEIKRLPQMKVIAAVTDNRVT
ncbi:hypothetical protein BT96DRAFT_1010436 [Gymnopus androsaceus JB14]|uniref:Uncharacterized protein n=1 Tax=Gymnopus androsaceus JB14 TaxID=1447944 RepID=A0A6A4GAQ2_9AGAR|nr:hypothetical protein BT96DRAFT_1010436 [Gymnopus androsaceus JB14]